MLYQKTLHNGQMPSGGGGGRTNGLWENKLEWCNEVGKTYILTSKTYEKINNSILRY